MEQYEFSAVFIPWERLKFPGKLNGRGIDFSLPVYWAHIPVSIDPFQTVAFVLEEDDFNNIPVLLTELTQSIIRNQGKVIVFGTNDQIKLTLFLFDKACMSTKKEMSVKLQLHYGKKDKRERVSRYYIQCDEQRERSQMAYLLDGEFESFSSTS
ncbi:MAG TPA: hypothetical protein VL576_03390 [Candidatus Paceibacterota bacterium]|jgi:hypothetical protein|nr:hypothetical protein [Candidatus Paceibacterota bacterium]